MSDFNTTKIVQLEDKVRALQAEMQWLKSSFGVKASIHAEAIEEYIKRRNEGYWSEVCHDCGKTFHYETKPQHFPGACRDCAVERALEEDK